MLLLLLLLLERLFCLLAVIFEDGLAEGLFARRLSCCGRVMDEAEQDAAPTHLSNHSGTALSPPCAPQRGKWRHTNKETQW